MKRIYKNTDLNFPISLLPVTENEELIVKFFTRSDKQFIQKTKDDIIDGHIMLAWSEIATLDEGVLNAWTLISSHDNNLPDDSYDVAEVTNTPYYVVTNQKSEWDDSIENTILNNYYTKGEIDEKLSNFDIGDINLSDYYTKKEVDEKVANVSVDLTGYATESWVNEQLQDVEVDLTDYYTKGEVDEALQNVSVDLTGYATESWVNEQIENIDIPTTDLTDYYTKGEVDEKVANVSVDLTGYATEQWVENKGYITGVDLSNYATEAWVNEQLQDVEVDVDLTGYATEQWVENKGYITGVNLTDYATEAWVNEQLKDVKVDVDLTDYYTKGEVDEVISKIDIPDVDVSDFVSKEWIKEQDYTRQTLVTQAEYDAMEKEENVMYIITDIEDEWVGTQSEYEALENKNPDTTYFIIEG